MPDGTARDELMELVMDRVLLDDGCWEWSGHVTVRGYGALKHRGKVLSAHRVVFELFRGPVPGGLQLDHLCRNRSCVRPGHLEPVTARVNTLRSDNPPAINARKTHCKRGHPLSGENLYRYPNGERRCRACFRLHSEDARLRRRANG